MGNDCLLPRCIACTCGAGGPSQRAPPRPGAAASGTGGGCSPPRPLLLPQPGAAGARGAPGLDLPPSREGEGFLQNSRSRVRASTGVCRSHTGARCPCWPGKDPCPQPRVPDGGPGPQAAVGLEQSAEGHEALHASGGSVGGGDKGQEAGGRGASPQPRLQPLGTGRLLPADTASHCQAPPWERLHFQGGGMRCRHCTGRTTSPAPCVAREPVTGGGRGASGQTSSPPHTSCQQAESCPPRGPEFGLGTRHLPVPGGESAHGRACRSPRGLPGTDKAARVHGGCWLRLPAWHKGEHPARQGPRKDAGLQGRPNLQHPLRQPGTGARGCPSWCHGMP